MMPQILRKIRPGKKRNSILFCFLSVILLVTAGLFAFSPPNPANASSTLTFNPTADAYVNQSQPTSNYGNNKSIRTDGSPILNSYLRFDVSGIGNAQVTKVTLRIYANSRSRDGFTVRKVADNNWQENKINYQNAPLIGDSINTSSGFSGSTWVSVDVTSLLSTDGTVSIAVVDNDTTQINLASKENTTHQPELIVETSTVSVPTDTQTTTVKPSVTPTDTQTPTLTPTDIPTQANTELPTAPSGGDFQPGFPIRAAFLYPWFPEAWNQQGYNPFTNYTPSLGFYDSSSTSVIQNQIQAMTYGNINAAILSWWGQGSKTDQRVSTILDATPGSSNPNFRWTIYYENESQGDPAVSQIENDLTYIQSNYGSNPSYLRVNGKFVVFVYADANDGCGMADRWVQADDALGHPAYIVLKVFSGYRNCASQPDSWHQYGPAVATDEQKGFSYTISPGFWKKGETTPRLARDLTAWTNDVQSMMASGDPWQLITTFNEWGEGTSVESAQEWASSSGFGQYLDVLHANGVGNPPPQPTATAQPTNPPATATPTGAPSQNPSPTATSTTSPTQTPSPAPTSVGGSGQVPNFSHIITIIFENKEYGSVVGSSSWPNFNSLANQYTQLINFYAETHPSLPNYLALTGGSTQGVTSDCTNCFFNMPNIADQIDQSGRTWKAYMESMPSPCYVGDSGTYAQKHNPFVYYDDIRLDTTRCQSHDVPLTQLDADLSGNLPNYVWITPNLCNDAHDCSSSVADAWLGTEVNKILSSPSFDQNSLLIITFDEGTSGASCCGLPSSAGGHIPTILISNLVKQGYQDSTPYDHYSLVKTIENAWGMSYLAHAGDSSTNLITIPWVSTSSPTPTTAPKPSPTPTATSQVTPTSTATTNPTASPTATQPSSGNNDPILFFTSDLVSGNSVDRATLVVNLIEKLMGLHPGTQMLVASGGDNEQENSPTISDYQNYFGTTYGTFVTQGILMQVRGNHDIQSAGSYIDFNGTVHSTGAAYWDYFGNNAHMFDISGQKLTDYSYNLGTWHIIGLDQLNGSVNTATLNFLKSDLAANSSYACQLVYWHVPTYSSGAAHGDATGLIPLNQAEYDAGVDIQLNGHDHDYQRFWPINPNGVRDDANGITTFIAGIGGQDGRSGSQASIAQAASAIYLDAFSGGAGHAIGVIQFILHATSADYTLYDANDGSILDQGTVNCH